VDEVTFFPKDIKDIFISSSKKIILVFSQAISITDSYKDPTKEIFTTASRINASKYDTKTSTLFLALADGKIVSLKDGDERQVPRQIAEVAESNWGEIGFCSSKGILAAGFGNNLGAIYLWNYAKGERLSILRGHNAKITGLVFSSDGKYMASASYDGTVRLWNMDDLNALPIVFDDHDSWVTSVTFTPDNKFVISGDKNGNIKVLPVEITTLLDDFCNYLPRTLTPEEWNNYVGQDITYSPKKCEKPK
jgi:WD40 repeat protein